MLFVNCQLLIVNGSRKFFANMRCSHKTTKAIAFIKVLLITRIQSAFAIKKNSVKIMAIYEDI